MRRKILAVLAFAAAGMLLLTACTSSKTGNHMEKQTSAADHEAEGTEKMNTEYADAKETELTLETVKADTVQSGKNEEEDIWSGSYAGDQERVTLRLNEDNTISFSFEQSGIFGDAKVEGSEAVYSGDDDHILTFQMGQGLLSVTVTHAEGYDTSASPLNGTYVPSY